MPIQQKERLSATAYGRWEIRLARAARANCPELPLFVCRPTFSLAEVSCWLEDFRATPNIRALLTVIQLLWVRFGPLNRNNGPGISVRRSPLNPDRSVLESSVNAINRGGIARFRRGHDFWLDWISDLIVENVVGESDAIFHVLLSHDSTISPENLICRS